MATRRICTDRSFEMIRRFPPLIMGLVANQWVRLILLTLYYLAILVGLIALYGRGDFSTPPFVYQNF